MAVLDHEMYNRIKVLGEGSYGKAYLVEHIFDKTKFVLKQINLNSMKEDAQKEALKEARILEVLKHPNIIRFHDVYKTRKGKLCIIMDYADGGDLAQQIKNKKGVNFSENQILDWFTQICLAIKHTHDRKILHRDLKSSNIFLTSGGLIKLGDFGIAKPLQNTRENAKTVIGTPYYISPEIINNEPYSFKSDIWSLGIILYELCALKPPFTAQNLTFLALKIVKGAYTPLGNGYSKEIQLLISQMLNINPNLRPSINQILSCPIITTRIKNFLSESERSKEFSHTVIHNKHIDLNKHKSIKLVNENISPQIDSTSSFFEGGFERLPPISIKKEPVSPAAPIFRQPDVQQKPSPVVANIQNINFEPVDLFQKPSMPTKNIKNSVKKQHSRDSSKDSQKNKKKNNNYLKEVNKNEGKKIILDNLPNIESPLPKIGGAHKKIKAKNPSNNNFKGMQPKNQQKMNGNKNQFKIQENPPKKQVINNPSRPLSKYQKGDNLQSPTKIVQKSKNIPLKRENDRIENQQAGGNNFERKNTQNSNKKPQSFRVNDPKKQNLLKENITHYRDGSNDSKNKFSKKNYVNMDDQIYLNKNIDSNQKKKNISQEFGRVNTASSTKSKPQITNSTKDMIIYESIILQEVNKKDGSQSVHQLHPMSAKKKNNLNVNAAEHGSSKHKISNPPQAPHNSEINQKSNDDEKSFNSMISEMKDLLRQFSGKIVAENNFDVAANLKPIQEDCEDLYSSDEEVTQKDAESEIQQEIIATFFTSDHHKLQRMHDKLENNLGEPGFIKAYKIMKDLYNKYDRVEEFENFIFKPEVKDKYFGFLPKASDQNYFQDLVSYIVLEKIIDSNPARQIEIPNL